MSPGPATSSGLAGQAAAAGIVAPVSGPPLGDASSPALANSAAPASAAAFAEGPAPDDRLPLSGVLPPAGPSLADALFDAGPHDDFPPPGQPELRLATVAAGVGARGDAAQHDLRATQAITAVRPAEPTSGPAPAPALAPAPTSSQTRAAATTAATAATTADAPPASRRRRASRRRLPTQRIFSELAAQAAIPPDAYAINEEVDGTMCLVRADEGFEVFNSLAGARHEVRVFQDEESAYFYLFGVLVAEAVRTGALAPRL